MMSSPKKVILLHNFDRAGYTKLVSALNSVGLSENTIVAVTTPVTLEWKVSDLIDELFSEDESLRKERQE
ncbi:MAG: hypothetical protein AMDU3_IPLC00003G0069 [Thermoplasmatales archaeon I-plasma]|jgi:hypothetical protein|nr:MAG: hypothetical protein AMDU3_IPLC00003G0069 [Thermoplasmatales archaeon I-plasma]